MRGKTAPEKLSDGPESSPSAVKSKKPYSTPELVVYGTLREITGNIGMKGSRDGGSRMAGKTH